MSHPPRRTVPRRPARRRPAAVVAFVLLTLLAPGSALAKNPITRFAAGPVAPTTACTPNLTPEQMTPVAGTRSDFCVAFYVDGGDPATGDDLRATVADTPQGFLATADTSPQCTAEQLLPDSSVAARCPANTQVGEGLALLRVDVGGIIVAQQVKAKVWNMVHSPDEVAGIAIELAPELAGIALPHVKLQSRTVLRPNPDVGLRTIISGQPRTANLGALGVRPIAIDGFFLRFYGSKTAHPSMPQSFAMLGSDCSKDQVSHIESQSWSGETSTSDDSYRLTDCDSVPFGVKTSVTTEEHRPDVPTAATIQLDVDQNSDPKVTANMSSTTLTLPAGLELGAQIASGADGLPLCTEAQFGWSNPERAACPASSKVADVAIISPLQANTFVGAAYVGEQKAAGELPQLMIEAGFGDKPDSPRVKLIGQMHIDDQNRITATLSNLPQVLFRQFKLTFRGGDHAAMVTPRQCGTTTGFMDATGAGGQTIHDELPLAIDQDCIDPAAFTPSMSLTSTSLQAGASGVTTFSTIRPDRQARIAHLVEELPAGVISNLNGVTECTTEQAANLACPESSRIGTVTSTSGVGPAPSTVSGSVYLAPRQDGDVAGAVIAVPVKFGGVNLGNLNLPARIHLRPGDFGLEFTADVPQRYKGLSLNLRSFSVSLDRPGFGINPTNCGPLSATSQLTSDMGTTAAVPVTFQVSGCEALSFDPSLALAVTGQAAPGQKPTITVGVSLAAGGSNIKSTSVTLPLGLGADLTQIPRACTQAAWDATACPADSIVGTAQAKVRIAPDDIAGQVSLVKIPGQTLPGIGIQLLGRFSSKILGSITVDKKTGGLVTQFASLPDVPITSLRLTLDGGPRGSLIATKSLCETPKITMVGNFVGQSGATATRTTTTNCPAALSDVAPLARLSGSAHSTVKLKVTAPTGQKIKTVRFTLPSTVSINRKLIGKKGAIKGTKTIRVVGKRTIEAVIAKGGAATVNLTMPKGLLILSAKAKKKASFTVSARIAYVSGARHVVKLKIKR